MHRFSFWIETDSFEQIVAGGGAVEAALSVYLENFAKNLGSLEQMAVAEFAQSLLIIPKVLTHSILPVFSFTLNHITY